MLTYRKKNLFYLNFNISHISLPCLRHINYKRSLNWHLAYLGTDFIKKLKLTKFWNRLMESFKAFQNWASESEKKVTVKKERYEWTGQSALCNHYQYILCFCRRAIRESRSCMNHVNPRYTIGHNSSRTSYEQIWDLIFVKINFRLK